MFAIFREEKEILTYSIVFVDIKIILDMAK
mgnify:CR=1 FL=1